MRWKQGCRLWILALLAAAADRLSKAAALRMTAGVHALWPGVLRLRRTSNTGMAFSMLSGQTLALTLLTFLVIAAVIAWLIAHPRTGGWIRAGLWLIVGGGLGNLYDRLTLGYVIDFIEPAFVRFAVFNVADVCICAGAAMVVIGAMIDEIGKKRARAHGDI